MSGIETSSALSALRRGWPTEYGWWARTSKRAGAGQRARRPGPARPQAQQLAPEARRLDAPAARLRVAERGGAGGDDDVVRALTDFTPR